MKIVTRSLQRLRQMPEILAMLTCLFAFFGPLCILTAILPFSSWSYEGQLVSFEQFWKSGGGILVVSFGASLTLLAIGFYRSQGWVRFAIPLAFVVMTIYSYLRRDPLSPHEWAAPLVWVFLSAWYFNRKRNVVEYFRKKPNAK